MTRPYARVTYNGATLNARTQQAIQVAEKKLGYSLTLLQGSYNTGGVSASSGTHDGGGAVDLAPYDYARKCRALRRIGFAAWHRPAIAGLWPEHIHAILLGDREASPAAKQQMADYRNKRDGLADGAKDTSWRPPTPLPAFKYKKDGL